MPDTECTTYLSSTGEMDVQLFQASLDCIKMIDANGYITQVNPGAVHALELGSIEDISGEHWSSLWPEESRSLVSASIGSGLKGERVQFAAFCPTAKGSPRWWDVIVSPVRDADGKIAQLMAISRDVTEVHEARKALREADVRKDEFLAILAHELRNPLSAASMAAAILESKTVDADRAAHLGKLISRQVGHMSRLVEDLIDISRVARGLIDLQREPVDMHSVVDDAIEQLQGAATAKAHVLSLTPAAQPCMVSGDRTRLLQAVSNILGNAVRYTPEGGRIDVVLSRDRHMVSVTVVDSGIGIPPEKMVELFSMFKQGAASGDGKSPGLGLGLGLALVQKLAELHDGAIVAHSGGEGMGSKFTLSLPAIS